MDSSATADRWPTQSNARATQQREKTKTEKQQTLGYNAIKLTNYFTSLLNPNLNPKTAGAHWRSKQLARQMPPQDAHLFASDHNESKSGADEISFIRGQRSEASHFSAALYYLNPAGSWSAGRSPVQTTCFKVSSLLTLSASCSLLSAHPHLASNTDTPDNRRPANSASCGSRPPAPASGWTTCRRRSQQLVKKESANNEQWLAPRTSASRAARATTRASAPAATRRPRAATATTARRRRTSARLPSNSSTTQTLVII